MAEILDKENSKSNARNSRVSLNMRVSLDGRQSILPHFRTSFASFDVGTKPRRYSLAGKPNSSNNGRLISLSNPQTILPSSQNGTNPKRISTGDASHSSRNIVEKPRLSDNGGNSRRSTLPHYRKSFVSCNYGGNSRVISSRKPSSSKERNDVVPHYQISVSRNSGERKSTSNLRGSILPHYRTSFYTCTSGGGYPRSSSTGKLQSLNNEKNAVQTHQSSLSSGRNSTGKQICSHLKEQANLPLHLRTSTGSCHDSCKHGVLEIYEEKPRVSIAKRNIPLPSPNHNNNRRTIAQDDRKKRSSSKQYSSDSEIHVPKLYNSKQEISNSSKKRSCSAKSRPTRENPSLSPEVAKRLTAKRNRVTNTTMSSEPVQPNPKLPENKIQTEIPSKIIQSPSPSLSTSASSMFTSEEDFSDSDEFEFEYEYTDSEYSYGDSESVTSESSDVIPEKPRRRTTSKIMHYVTNEDSPPVKLKFRRGRIIEIEKDEDKNGPRRLRFRRGKVVESKEDGKIHGRMRIYRKRVDNGRIVKHKSSPENEKVSLKHQDVKEKKNLQGLLNNVIEETASKLVESRSSKVKALVGAFETVFSAVDTPPATPTST